MLHTRLSRAAWLACVVPFAPVQAADLPQSLCAPAAHEERVELEEARLAVEIARAELAGFEEVFVLVNGLWEIQAIDRMSYLRARFDRDAARLDLERSGLLVARQEALLRQYELACTAPATDETRAERSRRLEQARADYLRADCDQQAKAVEVATVDLEFRREWLASVLDLRAGDVGTRQDVILAELDVRREELRLADAQRRTALCRAGFGAARQGG